MVHLHPFLLYFQRETNFVTSCLLTWKTKSSKNGVCSYKEFAPMGVNSFLFEMISIYLGSNNENDRVASPESVPICLKWMKVKKPIR